ncbi:AsmA family protein [Colwellia sp. M166]|uniref:AsmA family protein n=1 Tax=Colwellia sp. M166 TaxID=2583805 RepID=UPI00211E6DB7|nr:AsmA family protein [Colwellia sp. M166]
MKIIASIIVVLLLLSGGALWFLANGSLNEYIKSQIETVGTQVTEQAVTVKAVDIKLTSGAGSILGINLANPETYSQPNAFSLAEMTLDINLESLTSSPIIIDAIVIKSPEAFVQFTQTGGSNIQDILDAIERNTPKTETTVEAPASDSKEPKVKVSKIILAGTALTLDLSAFGNKEHNATLPDITLNNVGGDAGLPASQLGSEIVKQALSTIWQQAKATQKKKLIDNAKDKLKEKAKKKLTDLFG